MIEVKSYELQDPGVAMNGHKAFGVDIGGVQSSFAVLPADYDRAVTFILIGVLEAFRATGMEAGLQTNKGVLAVTASGDIEWRAEEGVLVMPDWGAAILETQGH